MNLAISAGTAPCDIAYVNVLSKSCEQWTERNLISSVSPSGAWGQDICKWYVEKVPVAKLDQEFMRTEEMISKKYKDEKQQCGLPQSKGIKVLNCNTERRKHKHFKVSWLLPQFWTSLINKIKRLINRTWASAAHRPMSHFMVFFNKQGH